MMLRLWLRRQTPTQSISKPLKIFRKSPATPLCGFALEANYQENPPKLMRTASPQHDVLLIFTLLDDETASPKGSDV